MKLRRPIETPALTVLVGTATNLSVFATNPDLESCPDFSTLKTADVARLAPFGGGLQFVYKIDFLQENPLLLVAAMA
jgi:hypothetical protein